ncbi:MAG: hypothetical protein ACFFCS_20020 [Candidatus Hodarchaeota archaeon]
MKLHDIVETEDKLRLEFNYRDDMLAISIGLILIVILEIASWVTFITFGGLEPWLIVSLLSLIQVIFLCLLVYIGKIFNKMFFHLKTLLIDNATKKISIIVKDQRGDVRSKDEFDLDEIKGICIREITETSLPIKTSSLTITFLNDDVMELNISNRARIKDMDAHIKEFISKNSINLDYAREKNERYGLFLTILL